MDPSGRFRSKLEDDHIESAAHRQLALVVHFPLKIVGLRGNRRI